MIIKKSSYLLLVCLFVSLPLLAQDSRNQVFGGFSYTSADFQADRENFYGFQGSYTHYFNDKVGFTADFGGQFGSIDETDPLAGSISLDLQSYQFLFGPQVRTGGDKASAFVHGLFGGAHKRVGAVSVSTPLGPFTFPGESETGFAIGIGGGVDITLSERVALRAVQVDFIPNRIAGEWLNDVRLGIGLAFNF